MLVRDIDKRLDMRLILKLRQSTDFFKSTKELDIKLPVYIYGKDQETWMATYIPKIEKNTKVDLLVKKFNGIEKEDAFVIDTRINNVKDMAVLNKLMQLPSFIINRSDMSQGFLNIYGRFHSSIINEVSGLLAQYTADVENSRVDWLGPSYGIMWIMDLINSEYPISLVTYRVPLEGEEYLLNDIIKEPGAIAEVRNNLYENDKISAVVYTNNEIMGDYDGLTRISPKDGIYQVDVSNQFHNLVRRFANEKHVMRTRYFIKPIGKELEMNVFLPTNSVYEYYSILYKLAREHDNRIVVTSIMPYSQSIWDLV